MEKVKCLLVCLLSGRKWGGEGEREGKEMRKGKWRTNESTDRNVIGAPFLQGNFAISINTFNTHAL